jgi:hypothetical protein
LKGSKDCAANQFRDLGDYGVAVAFNLAQSAGKPINQFHRDGSKRAWSKPLSRTAHFAKSSGVPQRAGLPAYSLRIGDRFQSEADGVGNNPNALSAMGSAQGRRRNVFPFRIIPDGGQVSENSAKPSPRLFARATKQPCDVLQDDETGSKVASKPNNFGVKATARAAPNASSVACGGNVLTGEATRDDINGANPIGSKSLCGKGADIIVAGDIGPVLGEDFARERFDFAEGDGLETACSFKAKAKPSDAREKIEDAEFFHSPHPVFVRSIAHTPAEERAKRLAVQVRGEVGEGVGERHAL